MQLQATPAFPTNSTLTYKREYRHFYHFISQNRNTSILFVVDTFIFFSLHIYIGQFRILFWIGILDVTWLAQPLANYDRTPGNCNMSQVMYWLYWWGILWTEQRNGVIIQRNLKLIVGCFITYISFYTTPTGAKYYWTCMGLDWFSPS